MNYSDLIKLYFEEKQNVAKNFPVIELDKLTKRLIHTYDMMEQYIQWLMEEPHRYLRGLVRI